MSKNNEYDRKITRFGYIVNKNSLDDETLVNIKKDLTVKPFKPGNYAKLIKKDDSFPVYVENGDYIGIPKYYGLEKLGPPEINKIETCNYPRQKIKFTGKLRPRQQEIIDKVIDGLDVHKGGLLLAFCGIGKTILAIYLACHYKLKTLFVVHKTFLKDQFIDRVKSMTNIKEIGIIQGQKKIDVDHPFVVGMVQSISKIDYDDAIFKDFGMIIIDEVHHMGARNFSKLYQKISTKYMLGISAERNRTDGLYKIINWYMGPVLHAEEQKPNDMVVVKKFHFKTSNEERSKVIINKYTNEPDRSTMITNLVHIKKRNRLILKMIEEFYDQGKNVLCLTGRIKQVNLLYKLLKKNKYTKTSVGKYIGGMPETELAVSATRQIILGTFSMAEEGLDIDGLNVVILCTPKSAIKQSVGRILRKEVYEEHPIVVDIIDEDNNIFKKQAKTRESYYHKHEYNIQDFNVADHELERYANWDDIKFIRKSLLQVPDVKSKKKFKKSEHTVYQKGPINCDELDFLDD